MLNFSLFTKQIKRMGHDSMAWFLYSRSHCKHFIVLIHMCSKLVMAEWRSFESLHNLDGHSPNVDVR